MCKGTTMGNGILGFVLLGVLVSAQPAWAQARTTGGRVSDLEQRVDEMLRLNEAFLPTVEQLATRLETLERQVAQLPSSVAAYDARRDVAELRNRIATLEAATRRVAGRNSTRDSGRDARSVASQVTPLRVERDLLAARLDGTEARIETIAGRASEDIPSGGQFRPRPGAGAGSTPVRQIVDSTAAAIQAVHRANGTAAAAGRRRYTIVIQVFEENDADEVDDRAFR